MKLVLFHDVILALKMLTIVVSIKIKDFSHINQSMNVKFYFFLHRALYKLRASKQELSKKPQHEPLLSSITLHSIYCTTCS